MGLPAARQSRVGFIYIGRGSWPEFAAIPWLQKTGTVLAWSSLQAECARAAGAGARTGLVLLRNVICAAARPVFARDTWLLATRQLEHRACGAQGRTFPTHAKGP